MCASAPLAMRNAPDGVEPGNPLSRCGRVRNRIVLALAVAWVAIRLHAPAAAAVSIVVAAAMFVVAVRRARRQDHGDASTVVAPWRSTRSGSSGRRARRDSKRTAARADSGAYEVQLALWGAGTLIVPARFDAATGHEFGSELWSTLQRLRSSDSYRG